MGRRAARRHGARLPLALTPPGAGSPDQRTDMEMTVKDWTETERWDAFDAMAEKRDAKHRRPWSLTDYLVAFLYFGLLGGVGFAVYAILRAMGLN